VTIMNRAPTVCTRCVMDTSDPEIEFDDAGVCNHCRRFDAISRDRWFPGPEGRPRLDALLAEIRRAGRGREYDCILGLSGGIDSSYLALRAAEWNLRPLVVHVDAGWNSELSVANIERIVRHCKFDLHTHVVDWEEIRDLHLAYLRSGIANQDVPQDHIFFSSLYHFAVSNGIRHVLSGGNLATEGIFPSAWHGSAMDATNLRAIHRQHGSRPLRQYKTISFFQYYMWYPLVKGMKTVRPLNYIAYDKAMAVKQLVDTIGFVPYQRKHGESLFTKVFQNHYLPARFGFDKRRPHLSSLIVSGQLTRSEALQQLSEPLYEPLELENDLDYLCKKLRITRVDFDGFLAAPLRHYSDYPNFGGRYRALKWCQATAQRLLGRRVSNYS
jgi:N-acetyl sugar amidotransferase